MPIEVKVTGDTVAEIDIALKSLIRNDLAAMSLDELFMIAQGRFAAAGFTLKIDGGAAPLPTETAENVQSAAPSNEATSPAKSKRTRLPKVSAGIKSVVDANQDDDEAEIADGEKSEEQLEADRAYVLDQLGSWFADPAKKLQTKAFIDRIAARNNGVRMSLLDAKLFPAIRREMNTEFGVGGNGHAGS